MGISHVSWKAGLVAVGASAALLLSSLVGAQYIAQAATTSYVVNTAADGPSSPSDCSGTNTCTLRDALTLASAGTDDFSISFAAPYHITLTNGPLTLGHPSGPNTITIAGRGQTATIIDGGGQTRVFDNETNSSLHDLTITNGSFAGRAGGIYDNGVLALTHVTLSQNTATTPSAAGKGQGGAIYLIANRALTISDSTFSFNTATRGGAIFAFAGTVMLFDDRFDNNTATGSASPAVPAQGGAIATQAHSNGIYNTVFTNNHATGTSPNCSGNAAGQNDGGAIYAGVVTASAGGATAIVGGSITGNTADCLGGGAFGSALFSLQGTTIVGNAAGASGGGLYSGGFLSLTDASVTRNTAGTSGNIPGLGGGLFLGGPASVSGGSLGYNSAIDGSAQTPAQGGGIYNASNVSITGARILGNSATQGAGVFQAGGSVTLQGDLITLNQASGDGAGIYQAGSAPSLLLGRTQVISNTAGGTAGGLYNPSYTSTLATDGSAVSGNHASTCPNTLNPCPPSSPAYAPIVLTVNSTGDGTANPANCPGPSCGLRDAVAKASDSSYPAGTSFQIRLKAAEYDLSQGTLTLSNNIIEIDGVSASSTTVKNTSGAGSVFDVETNAVLRGMTVTGGQATSGGGVYDNGMLAILTSAVTGNTATSAGGGIYLVPENSVNPLYISQTAIGGNISNGDGGGLDQAGQTQTTLLAADSIANNTAANYGGGVSNSATMAIAAGTFTNNSAASNGSSRGGGLYTYYSGFSAVRGSTFTGNSSDFRGGGTYNDGEQAWVGTTFQGNSAVQGGGGMGAFDASQYNSSLVALSFRNNTAGNDATQGFGAGLYLDSPGMVIDTVFSNNTASAPSGTPGVGGGVFSNDENVFLRDTFMANTAGDGAGLYDSDVAGDFIPVSYSSILLNHATHDGAGIYEGDSSATPVLADILLSHTRVTQNHADNDGGGVHEMAYPLVFVTDSSAVSGNTAGNGCADISPCP